MISTQYAIDVHLKRKEVPSFDSYPLSLSAVRHLDVLPLHPAVTYFVGENGSGKSTLLEAIAVALGLKPEGGSRNNRFTTRPPPSAVQPQHPLHHALLPLGAPCLPGPGAGRRAATGRLLPARGKLLQPGHR